MADIGKYLSALFDVAHGLFSVIYLDIYLSFLNLVLVSHSFNISCVHVLCILYQTGTG